MDTALTFDLSGLQQDAVEADLKKSPFLIGDGRMGVQQGTQQFRGPSSQTGCGKGDTGNHFSDSPHQRAGISQLCEGDVSGARGRPWDEAGALDAPKNQGMKPSTNEQAGPLRGEIQIVTKDTNIIVIGTDENVVSCGNIWLKHQRDEAGTRNVTCKDGKIGNCLHVIFAADLGNDVETKGRFPEEVLDGSRGV